VETDSSERSADALPNRSDVTALLRSSLTFLEERPGGRVEVEESGLLTVIAYVFDELVIEVSVDWRDLVATYFVARSVNGQRPPGYLVHDGVRMRYRLSELLPRSGDGAAARSSKKRRRPTGDERVHNLVRQITDTAARLDASLDLVWDEGVRRFRPDAD
jgi:hypothetical protein